MNRQNILLLAMTFVISSLHLSAQSESETRNLSDFDQLSVATGIHLELVPGSSNRAEITAENVELEEVITEIDGDRLKVKIQDNRWGFNLKRRKKKVHVTLTYTDLEEIDASSGAKVSSEYVVRNDELELGVSSGASMKLEVEGNSIEADASSGASMKLKGKCEKLDVAVSSGSSIKATDLEAYSVNASASSGANVKVWSKNALDARASSGGSISYKGNPQKLNKKKSSGGGIHPY